MKTILSFYFVGLAMGFVLAQPVPLPGKLKLANQFTCTKCNYTIPRSIWNWEDNASMGKYWLNTPNSQSRRDYLCGSSKTPYARIENHVNKVIGQLKVLQINPAFF
jgi:hypothetical protein